MRPPSKSGRLRGSGRSSSASIASFIALRVGTASSDAGRRASGRGRVDDAAGEEDRAGRLVPDEEEERVVDEEGRRLLALRRRAGEHRDGGGGGGLGALLVDGDERLVEHLPDE